MAMGQRTHEEQTGMWVAVSELPRPVSHRFYQKLNRLLVEHGFDDFVETQCGPFYAEKMGRPSLAPGQYFRLLLRGLQGRLATVWAFCFTLWVLLRDQVTAHRRRGLNLGLFAVSSHRFEPTPSVL